MENKKLSIVTDYYWPQKGGAEAVAQTLASLLRVDFDIQIITHGICSSPSLFKRFFKVKEIPPTDPDGNTISLLRPGIREKTLLLPLAIWDIPACKKIFVYDLLYFFYKSAFRKKIISLLKDTDIVHCISTGYLARCISEICRKKRIRLINNPFIHFGKWGDSPGQINAYKRSDTLVCPTESFKNDFLSVAGNFCNPTIVVIPPPILIPRSSNQVNNSTYGKFILFIGRREKHKGLPLLLSAYQGLESLGKLLIVGPGEKNDSVSPYITDLGEADEETKQHLLSCCSLLCVPSNDESFGIVYVEAMSHGKPVVALDIPPVNEIIESGRTGILVPPKDTDKLHLAIKELMTNETMREEMGRAARHSFENRYNIEKIIGRYKQLYRTEYFSA